MQFKQRALIILAGLLSLTCKSKPDHAFITMDLDEPLLTYHSSSKVACDDAQGNKGVCKPPNFCCAADGFQCVFREECKS